MTTPRAVLAQRIELLALDAQRQGRRLERIHQDAGPDDDLDVALTLVTRAWADLRIAADLLAQGITPLPPATDVATLAAQQDAALGGRGYL